jgi:hypothetical protein
MLLTDLNKDIFIEKRGTFAETYKKYIKNGDVIIDVFKDHCLGFYKKYKNDPFDQKLPDWFVQINEKKAYRIVIKNLDYISFNSIGYSMVLDLYERSIIKTPDKEYKILTGVDMIFIVDKEFIILQKLLKEKLDNQKRQQEIKKYSEEEQEKEDTLEKTVITEESIFKKFEN